MIWLCIKIISNFLLKNLQLKYSNDNELDSEGVESNWKLRPLKIYTYLQAKSSWINNNSKEFQVFLN